MIWTIQFFWSNLDRERFKSDVSDNRSRPLVHLLDLIDHVAVLFFGLNVCFLTQNVCPITANYRVLLLTFPSIKHNEETKLEKASFDRVEYVVWTETAKQDRPRSRILGKSVEGENILGYASSCWNLTRTVIRIQSQGELTTFAQSSYNILVPSSMSLVFFFFFFFG